MGENGVGCDERDENGEGGKVGGYKNPRAAYCLRRRRAMVRRGGERTGGRTRSRWGRTNWDKQDRFYSSLGIIPGSRRSYIVLTLSGLPNYSSSSPLPCSPSLSVPFPRLEKCSFTLFVVLVYLFFSRSLPSLSSFRKTKKKAYENILSRLIFPT